MIPLISMATSSSSVNFFFFFFFFTTPSFFCFSQQNPEIQALQSFKSSIHDPLGALTSWDSTSPSAPCDWRGIFCSNDSYVSEIRLPHLQLSGFLTTQISDLRMLRKITLRSNFFNGTIPASISKCKLLDTVSFQYNSFSGQIPPEIMNLTDLETFNVAGNQMYGEIPTDLPVNLRYFDVSENLFTGGIPEKISELSQVILLNLSYNRFSGDIPASLGRLQQLQYLMLDYNELEGTVPSAISNCSSLVHLSAEGNGITGVRPAGIAALPKIKVINFSHNKLSGYLATSFFCNGSVYPPSLQIVQLSFNAFSEIIHPQSSTCFSSLQVLDIQHNQIRGDFPFFLTDNSALSSLDLSGNLFSGTIPSSIGNLLSLEQLRLGNNSFEGNIPVGITKCSSLSVLDLEGNRFIGEIPAFLGDLSNLKILSMGRNQFSGSIPSSFSNITSLESLNLEGNRLTGSLPEELMFLSNLSTLNLSGNKFSGSIPVVIENLQQLSVLNLSKNDFSGTIPSSIGTLYKLVVLDLSRLNLSGELPSVLGGLPSLQVIALQENNLSGNVPEGFSSLMGLQYLNLSSNSFSGHIPSTFGFLTSLVVLSLSKNHISGSVPPDLGNNTALKILNLRSNSLSGQIPSDLARLSHLSVLDLGRNTLTGEIPEVISNCSSLTSVLLDMNHLSGNIPASLSSLSSLITLDLSGNNLSGNIPENLTVLPNLVNFNVSNNKLEGQIPVKLGSHFNDPSDYSGNQGLCGEPLKRKCERTGNGKNRLIMLIAVSASGGLLLASFCCFYIYALLRWRRKLKAKAGGEKKHSPARVSSRTSGSRGSGNNAGPKLVMFNNRITVAETIEATREFDEENVLSRTRHGVLFKACYSDGMLLSICRLPDRSLDENTFRKEAESLGRVKHRNLTVLRGYYAGPPDLRLLAYDYMPNGNLATLLQEASHQDGGHVLNWPMRHLVALGIARGLAFLHAASIIHGDVKPQNVLFDADFEAHLSDFGLDKLTVATPAEPSSSTSVGTVGYVAPEATLTGEATRQSDIYSFGIVLLELLTGKKSLMFSQDEDIVKWVKRQLQRGQISELLEPGLLELDPESSEWEEFLLGVKVGLLCTAPDPLDRPTMTDTVFMLEGCRVDQISLS